MTDSMHRTLDAALTSHHSRTTAILNAHTLEFTSWGGGSWFCADIGGGRCGWSHAGPRDRAEDAHREHVADRLEAAS